MRLPTLGNEYSGEQLREMVRLIELEMTRLNSRLSDGSGGATGLSNADPNPLGTASPGTSPQGSRSDHVHQMPTAAQVGADPVGAAASAIGTHVAQVNPHPQYLTEQFPFSTNLIEAGRNLLVPSSYNLLITESVFEVRGSIDLRGSIVGVCPNLV